MAIRDHVLPECAEYAKLSDFPDGTTITIYNAGVVEGAKYGDMAYFVGKEGIRISLPKRYTQYVRDLVSDLSALDELTHGVKIQKDSRECSNGTITPTFEFIE